MVGRAARRALGACVLCLACGPSLSTPTPSNASGGVSTGASPGEGVEGSSGADGSSSSSTGVAPLEGPGCGDPPPCGRGTYDGHALIESQEDLARFEGYTEITGIVQIGGSQDLVCLDRLACLETVGQDLRIQQNAALQSTDGLRNLRQLGTAGPTQASPIIYIAENLQLTRLGRLDLPEVSIGQMVLWRNPALVDLDASNLPGLRSMSVLDNALLESLGPLNLGYPARCYVHRNPRLCMDELDALCRPNSPDYPRSHLYPGAECGDDSPPVTYDSSGEDCSLPANDCPEGQRCMPVRVAGNDRIECRQLAPEPKQVGESCELFGGGLDGRDDCAPRAYCRDGQCVPIAFGWPGEMACPSAHQTPTTDAEGYFNLCIPNCDPLARECREGRVCVPLDYDRFSCVELREEPARQLGEQCDWHNSCANGLMCHVAARIPTCHQLCDLRNPACPAGNACALWWTEDSDPVPTTEHVGVCTEP